MNPMLAPSAACVDAASYRLKQQAQRVCLQWHDCWILASENSNAAAMLQYSSELSY